MGKFPNTYCLSKCIAEDCVRQYAANSNLPISIFRPSIVVATYREPLRGWANNLYGPTGVLIGVGTGVLRTLQGDASKVADLIPVDMCVSALIACSWQTAKKPPNGGSKKEPVIYNYVSSAQKPLKWGDFISLNKKYGMEYPTMKCIWYYSFRLNKFRLVNLLYMFFLHFLPAVFVDITLSIAGQKPRYVVQQLCV